MIALRDENARLEDQVRQNDANRKQLTKQHLDTRDELKDARNAARAQEAKLKRQAMEVESLKVSRREIVHVSKIRI